MKNNFAVYFLLILVSMLTFIACGSGGSGKPSGYSSTVVNQSILPVGNINCPDGGIKLEYGIDDNRNGFLNTTEVDGVEYICHGANGLVNSSTLMSGNINCPAGGLQIDTGLDLNLDDILQDTEIAGSTFICKEEVTGPGLTVMQSSNAQLDLAWYGLGVGNTVEDFRVYESGVLIATLANSVSTYSDTGLGLDTLHCYRVVGVDITGLVLVQSNEVCATTGYDVTPPSATLLSLEQVSSSKLKLDWELSSDNIGVTGYNIYRDGVSNVSAVTNSYSDEGLSFMTTYCYVVTAYDAAGNESADSNTICTTMSPLDVTGDTPLDTSVDTASAYFVANVTSGWLYEVTLTGMTANADLYVYGSDSSFTNVTCSSTWTISDESCDLVADGDKLYIEVDGSNTLSGALLTLDVIETPVTTVTGSLPYSGAVDSDNAYFSVAVTPGTSYIVNMTGLTDDVDLRLYNSDADFNTADCSSSKSGNTDETCTLTVTGDVLYIKADPFGSTTSADFVLNMTVNPYSSEGSQGAPVDITGLTPYSGQVADIDSYYVLDVTPSLVYDVTLTGLSDNTSLRIYSDSAFSSQTCYSGAAGTIDELCTVGTQGTQLYIMADSYFGVSGASYTIDIAPASRVAEGTIATPVDITGITPYAGTVDLNASYYVNTVTPGVGYLVSMTDIAGSGHLTVYGDDSTFTNPVCSSFNPGTLDEYCAVTAVSSTMYIAINGTGSSAGAEFSLDMTDISNVAQGSVASPVDISSLLPYSGTVDSTASYYVNTVVPGEGYLISLTGISNNADLVVYDADSTYSTPACSSGNAGTTDDVCLVTATSTAMYIKVDGSTSGYGSSFDLNLAINPNLAEGSDVAPVDVTGLTPYAGTVDLTSSYYVNTVTPGKSYEISMTGLSDDADLYVYDDDSTYSTYVCKPYKAGTTDETCIVTASGTEMYIKVSGQYTSVGTGFVLDIVPLTGATYYIETVPNDSGSSADTYLRIFDSGLNQLALNDDGGPGLYSQKEIYLDSGETYYIEVDDYWNNGDYYSIRISAVGFNGTSTTGFASSYEPNDSSATATTLLLETFQHHALNPIGESDWLVFVAP